MYNKNVLKIYKEIRQPHYGFYSGTGKVYQYQVSAKSAISGAIYQEKVNRLWEQYEGDRVKLFPMEDMYADINDLMGDSYDPKVNPEINPRKLEEQKNEFIERVNRDGVWGLVSQYKCPTCQEWIDADSCWGFIGDDWKDSGIDLDLKWSALDKAGLWED